MTSFVGRFIRNRLVRNRSGAFAIQFALMAVPLCVCTGLAIDGGRAFLARYELASALDAAALAVGSSTETNTAKLEALAEVFVERNFRTPHNGKINLTLVPGSDDIKLTGDVTINTYFMPLVGQPYVNVSATSEVKRGGNNVEVSLALDITESMDGSRIAALKVAAKDLITTVVNDTQTPYFSKVAIAPWTNNIYAGDLADSIRGTIVGPTPITAATWKDGASKSISGATWKDGAAKTITAVTKASQAVVTSNGHGFSNGDYIYISGVSGMTQLNGKRYEVANVATNTFKIKNADTGAYINSSSYSTLSNPKNGTAQPCFTSKCEVRVSSSSHGFSNGDFLYITGVSGMTQINNSAGSTWTVKDAASGTYVLADSDGPSYSNYTSSGTAQRCFTSTCEVRVTSASHGIGTGKYTRITGVGGMTQLNVSGNTSWRAKDVTASTYILEGTVGPSYSNYTSGGSSQCLEYGCQFMRYTNNSSTVQIKEVSQCVTERTGAQAYTDAAPGPNPAGLAYPTGTYGKCVNNPLTPLTADKTLLKNRIDALDVTGSTAGQIGAAWSWYMLSPNWASVWPEEVNRPKAYGTKDLVKVAVLMTDGEFNTAHCDGIQSKNYAVNGNADKINCNSTNGAPYTQARDICAAMRAEKVVVYTVGFELAPNGNAASFMKDCATSEKHVYLAASADELKEAFKAIATSISKLRISR